MNSVIEYRAMNLKMEKDVTRAHLPSLKDRNITTDISNTAWRVSSIMSLVDSLVYVCRAELTL